MVLRHMVRYLSYSILVGIAGRVSRLACRRHAAPLPDALGAGPLDRRPGGENQPLGRRAGARCDRDAASGMLTGVLIAIRYAS